MAFTEDLAQFFEPKDFAVVAVFTRAGVPVSTTNVIFDDAAQSVSLYETSVEEAAPFLLAPTAVVAPVKRKDAVAVNGANFIVERLHPDGTGLTTIYLKQA